jgi:pimeloyl-[acyl-carrier protein] methyl ester esterase
MSLRICRDYLATLAAFSRSFFVDGELTFDQRQAIESRIVRASRLPEHSTALSALESMAAADMRPLLSQVRVPTLVIHGEEDPICPVGAGRFLAKEINGAQLLILPGAGHAPFMGNPQRVNDEMDHFLRGKVS